MVVIALGGAAGYLYWFYIGCNNGCAITSSPLNSTVYGAIMAVLLFNGIGTGSPGKNPDSSK